MHFRQLESIGIKKASKDLVIWTLRIPGVEGQQLGVDQDEGMQHLLAPPLRAAVELLHQAALQELDALLTQGRVDEALHCLGHTEGGRERESDSESE